MIPGFGLDRIFGAKEKLIRPTDAARIVMEPGVLAASPAAVNGAAFEEELEPTTGARVLGRFADGTAAIVENASGKGKGILIGSFLALGYQKDNDASAKQLFLSLARDVGVTPDLQVNGEGTANVEVRRLVNSHEQIVFAFNHSNAPVDTTVSVTLPWQPRQARNLQDDSPVPFTANDAAFVLHKNLAAGESWIVSLEAPR